MKNGISKVLVMNFIRISYSIMLLVSLPSKGQVLLPSISPEVQFPNAAMTPSSYNILLCQHIHQILAIHQCLMVCHFLILHHQC
jgi:hypothetical protein